MPEVIERRRFQAGREGSIEAIIFTGDGEDGEVGVKVRTAAAAAATTVQVERIDIAMSSGDMLYFGDGLVATLSANADVGAEQISVSGLPGPLRLGERGKKLQDLTGYTIEVEILELGGDGTPVIVKNGANITTGNQTLTTGRGRVQAALVAADTLTLELRGYHGAWWRRNSGSARPLKEFEWELVGAGFR